MTDLAALVRTWLRQPLVPAALAAYVLARMLLPVSSGRLLGIVALPFLVVVRPVLHQWYAAGLAGERLSPRAAWEWSQSHGYGALAYWLSVELVVVAAALTDPRDPARVAVVVLVAELVLAYPWAVLGLRDGTAAGALRSGTATLLRSGASGLFAVLFAAAGYAAAAVAGNPAARAGAMLLGLFGTGLVTATFLRAEQREPGVAYG